MRALFAAVVVSAVACSAPPSADAPRESLPLPAWSEASARLVARARRAPDARFVRAFAVVHHVLTGYRLEAPWVEPIEGGFRLQTYGKEVVLPDDADFGDALRVLGDAIARIPKRPKLDEGPPPVDADLLLDADALDALANVQSTWATAPTKRALHEATRALVGLVAFAPDALELDDETPARALAALALDRALASAKALHEEVLLARAMGYDRHARNVAATLADSDPLRAFYGGDEATIARATSAPILAGMLLLSRAVARGDRDAEDEVRKRWLRARALDRSVLAVRIDDEPADPKLVRALFADALLAATRDAGEKGASKADADVAALRRAPDPDPLRLVAVVHGWLGIQREEGLARFEEALTHVGGRDVGPFFDRGTRKALLRAQVATALHAIGRTLLETTAKDAAAAAFAVEAGSAATPFSTAARGWFHAVLEARRRGDPSLAAPLDPLGPIARAERVLWYVADLGPGAKGARAEASALAARLDARPAHRAILERLAREVLLDDVVVQRMTASRARIETPKSDTLARLVSLEASGDVAAALAAADAWIAPRRKRLSTASPPIVDAIARLRVANDQAASALEIVEPAVAAPMLRARAALVLSALGRDVEAEAHARTYAEQAGPICGAALLAELHARAGKMDAAARDLAELPPLAASRTAYVARGFAEALATRDPDGAIAAAKALSAARVPLSVVRAIADALRARNAHAAAIALLEAALPTARGKLARADLVLAIAAIKSKVEGSQKAAAWIAAHRDPTTLPFEASLAYEQGLPIDRLAVPGLLADATELAWLLAVARPETLRDAGAREAFRAHFASRAPSRFARIGAHLVGLVAEPDVRALPRSPAEQCELAYYLAIAAEARGASDEASGWLQVALDSGSESIAEWRFAAARARTRLGFF